MNPMNKDSKNSSSPIYVVMAVIFAVTAIAGFAPTSLRLISRVSSGQQAFPPFIVHFHAASMSLWLLLLLGQSILMYTGNQNLHKKLGILSLILAPCVLISMYGVEMLSAQRFLSAPEGMQRAMGNIPSGLLIHAVSYLFFPLFYLWSILVRQKDSESHKRLMILATLVLMVPGLGRLLSVTRVLPDFGLNLVDSRHLYLLLLIAPAIGYDMFKRGLPHRSYVTGITLVVIWIVLAHFFWGTSWWAELSLKLLAAK